MRAVHKMDLVVDESSVSVFGILSKYASIANMMVVRSLSYIKYNKFILLAHRVQN